MSILILILLVANTSLVTTHLGFRNLAENILVFFTVFYGIITGSLTILGFLNCATKTSLMVFLSIILIILTVLKLKRQQKFHLFVKYQEKKPDFYALCVGAFLLSWLINIVLSQRNLPPITTDGIYYHLPFSARWFQTGRLERIPIYFSDIAMSYYPLTGDLFYLMHFLIFASDIFVNLVQLPFALYAGCAIYLILRKVNVSKNSAIFASIFFIIIKPILKQVTLVFVDLMLVAFYFSLFIFYYLYIKNMELFLQALTLECLWEQKHWV
ncbi:MAG: hypothetical protein NC906_03545 [Candidatus Omnitrophica bacterium]|nr:hypothetical protein [Candidatus Omnitrophota bacterium]